MTDAILITLSASGFATVVACLRSQFREIADDLRSNDAYLASSAPQRHILHGYVDRRTVNRHRKSKGEK